MNKKILLTCFAVFLLLAIVGSVSALRTPGVAPLDWFIYDNIIVEWSSTDPALTCPDYLLEFNETEWLRAIVQSVVGTNITCQIVQYFKNDTEKVDTDWINIDNGEGNLTLMFIAADLNTSDALYTSGYYSAWTINKTILRTYPDGARLTNHFNYTIEETDPETGYYYHSASYYWDGPTGVLVEMNVVNSMVIESYTTYWSILVRITESSRWVVPEFPTLPLIVILFVTISFVVTGFKRRMLQTKNR